MVFLNLIMQQFSIMNLEKFAVRENNLPCSICCINIQQETDGEITIPTRNFQENKVPLLSQSKNNMQQSTGLHALVDFDVHSNNCCVFE